MRAESISFFFPVKKIRLSYHCLHCTMVWCDSMLNAHGHSSLYSLQFNVSSSLGVPTSMGIAHEFLLGLFSCFQLQQHQCNLWAPTWIKINYHFIWIQSTHSDYQNKEIKPNKKRKEKINPPFPLINYNRKNNI